MFTTASSFRISRWSIVGSLMVLLMAIIYSLAVFSSTEAAVLTAYPMAASAPLRPSAPSVTCNPAPPQYPFCVEKNGTVIANETWLSNTIYVIGPSSLTINPGVTVTIQPGTIVKFYAGSYPIVLGSWLDVFGGLDIQGVPGNPVIFTSYRDDGVGGDTNGDLGGTIPTAGDWDSIYLENSATTFKNAVVKYAYGGTHVWNATSVTISPTIQNNVFSDNIYGVSLNARGAGDIASTVMSNTFTANLIGLRTDAAATATGVSRPALTQNNFNNQVEYPIYLGATSFPTYTLNTFEATNNYSGIGLGGVIKSGGSLPIIPGAPAYVVVTNTTLNAGVVITFPAGSVIKFTPGTWLDVYGTLNTQGVSGNPVVFTSFRDDTFAGDTNGDGTCPSCTNEPAPGDWEALYLENDSTVVDRVVVRYGLYGLRIRNVGATEFVPAISNSTFDSNVNGLYLHTPGSGQISAALTSNAFSNNAGFPIYLDGSAFPDYISNTFTANVHPAIALSGTWNYSGTWVIVNSMPYVVDGNVTVTGTANLALPLGSVVKFNTGRYIDVQGSLDLQSTQVQPLIFTSFKDDGYAGDTNGDGSATRPARGDWDAIYLDNSLTTFDYATVKYATSGVQVFNGNVGVDIAPPILNSRFEENVYGVLFFTRQSGDITSLISGTTFYSNTYGLGTGNYVHLTPPVEIATGASRPTLTNNSFTNHSGFPIYLNGTGFPTYSGNTFANNTHPAIGLGGYFMQSGTWDIVTGDNSLPFPYVVTQNTTIDIFADVILPLGLVMKFDADKYLDVFGSIDIQSTPAQPMIFTSYKDDAYAGDTNADGSATTPAMGDWNGVYLDSSLTTFDYAVVKYSEIGVDVFNPYSFEINPPIISSRFEENIFGVSMFARSSGDITSIVTGSTMISNTHGLGTGVYVDLSIPFIATGASRPTLTNNSFTNHLNFPIHLNGTGYPEYTGNTNFFDNNYYPAIALSSYFMQSGTWYVINGDDNQLFPYVVVGDVILDDFTTVTLPVNMVMKFVPGYYLDVFGDIELQGNASLPTIFTSFYDDSYRGDTNADGLATAPAQADWKTIWLYNSEPYIHDAVFKYATAGIGVYYDGLPNTSIFPTLDNSRFEENLVGTLLAIGWDVNLPTIYRPGEGNITSLITNTTYISNSYGLATYAHPSSTGIAQPTLANVSFSNNSGFPIYLAGTAFPEYGGVSVVQHPAVGETSATTGQTTKAAVTPNTRLEALRQGITLASLIVGPGSKQDMDEATFRPTGRDAARASRGQGAGAVLGLTTHPDAARLDLLPNPQPGVAPQLNEVDSTQSLTVTFTNNVHHGIALGGHFNNTGTLHRVSNMPYAVIGNYPLIINGDVPEASWLVGSVYPLTTTVALPPGNVIKMGTGFYADIFGGLDLQGTSGTPVIFTSYKDDSVGGDTNADGAATLPAKGDWDAVYLESSSTTFDYGVVRYGTYGVHVWYNGPLLTNIFPEIHHTVFVQNTVGLGFNVLGDGDITSYVHDNLFADNGTDIFGKTGAGAGKMLFTVTNNDILGPTSYGFQSLSAVSTITATNNYWGHCSGPHHPTQNPSGLGVEVSDYVNFNPWSCNPIGSIGNYAIFGYVVDDDVDMPEPVAGVLITLSNGMTTTTNVLGYYAFNGLPPGGSYTVTPSLSGYAFTPVNYTVTVGPDVQVDFIASFDVFSSNRLFLPLIQRLGP